MSEWKKVKLGDVCEITSSKRCLASVRSKSGIPFFCSKEIICLDKGEDFEPTDFIPEELYNDIKAKYGVPSSGDLLLTTRGTNGIPHIYKSSDKFYFADGNLSWFKNFGKELSPQYLYYWFKSPLGIHEVDAISKGTAQKAVPIDGLRRIVLLTPLQHTQNRIVVILSRYDSLIENYQKQIKLLEEAAQRLYKEWFIDLHFPGHENTNIIDGVPEGWERKKVGETFKTVLGGTPSRSKTAYWNGDIPWINSGEVNKSRIIQGSEFITQEGLDHSATKLMPKHTTVLAITGATLGQVSYTEIETCANQSVVGIIDESNTINEYLFMYISNNIQAIINKATGGAQQHINKDIVNEFPIIIPKSAVLVEFTNRTRGIFEIIKSNMTQLRLLTEARDRLLPKLMSGAIEV